MISLPEFPPGPAITVSASSLMKYRQCPQKGLAHHRGVYGEASRSSWVGLLVHRLIARDLRDGRIDDIEQAAREEIGSSNLNYDLTGAVGKPSDIRRAIAEAVEGYREFSRLPRPELADVEVAISFDAGADVTLRGVIDGVEETSEGVRLVDWKSGPVRPEAAEQLTFYSLLWALEHERLPAAAEAVSIKTGERLGYDVAEQSLSEMAEGIGALVGEVRRALAVDGNLARDAGPWCSYCPILDSCDEGQTAVALLAK